MKYINGPILHPEADMGNDGTDKNPTNFYFGRDVMAFGINYYGGDYKPIQNIPGNQFTNNFQLNSLPTGQPLYNGNISSTLLALKGLNNNTTTGYTYLYDQLNRLLNTRQHVFGTASGSYKGNWSQSNTGTTDNYAETFRYDANGNILQLNRNGNSQHPGGLAMDRLNYTYRDGTNQLWSVQDGIAAGAYAGDIDNQGGSNYSYDRIGNLIGDVSENISQVNWTVYGKIGNIQKKQAFLGYVYNAGGERVVKQYLPYATNQCLGCDENTGLEDLEVYERNSAIPDTFKASKTVTFLSEYTEDERYREYSAIIDAELALCTPQCAARPALASSDADIYIRDATGNVLAVYHYDRKTSQLRWSEQHLYGSSRLGMYLPEKLLTSVSTDSKQREVGYLGKQVFELSNHLGNILATITDKKLQVSLNTTSTAYFEADVQTVQDYYAFGMQMPGRKFTQANISYRFGFNGKENDKDINAGGQDYGARIYDGRLGRWLSVDPLADHPNQVDKSPYSAFWNNPIMYDDPDGQCPFCPWLDAVVDVGFVLYDVGVLIHEKATTGSTSGENWAALGADGASILVPMSVGAGQAVKAGYKALKSADKANDVKKVVTKADDVAEGVIYKRVDKTGKQKDYVGQAKSDKRYDARQKEHKKANPEADYEFTQIDKGKPGKDLNQKEQKHLDKMGGPTNKSNPSGGTSNKKNVIKKN